MSVARALLLGLVGLSLAGCAHAPAGGPVDTAAEEAQVRALVDTFFERARARDWDAVGALLTEDFHIFVDDAASFDKPAYVAILKGDDLEVSSLQLSDLAIHVSSDGRFAWSRYHAAVKGHGQGRPQDLRTAETLIFRKEDGRWRISHAHASLKDLGRAPPAAAAGAP